MKKLFFLTLLVSLVAVIGLSAQDWPMYEAISNFDRDTVDRLLSNGFDINQPMYPYGGDSPRYALELAAYVYGGWPWAIERFLDAGADPRLHSPDDYTVLMWLLRSQDEVSADDPYRQAAFRIIDMGVDVRYQEETTGRTALHLAAGNGDKELVNLLIRRGADPNAEANQGWDHGTPARYARLGGHVQLAMELEGENPDFYTLTPHYAAKNGDIASLQDYISYGFDLNEQEPESFYTPLYYASTYEQVDAVRLLLQAGADPNPVDYAGITPLRQAVVRYNDDIARLLVDNGANPVFIQEQGCGAGMTELDWAVEYGQFELAKYMIEVANVNVQNTNYLGQLYGSYGEPDYAEYLVARGAYTTLEHVNRVREYSWTYADELLEVIEPTVRASARAPRQRFSSSPLAAQRQSEFFDRGGRPLPSRDPVVSRL